MLPWVFGQVTLEKCCTVALMKEMQKGFWIGWQCSEVSTLLKYSRILISRIPVCHFNKKGVQISEFFL